MSSGETMKVSVKKINDMKIRTPGKSAFTIQTKPNMFKLHTLMYIVSKRGGGKSTLISSLVKELIDDGVIDIVCIVTPTFESNRSMFEQFGKDAFDEENNVFEPTAEAPLQIEEFVQSKADELDDYLNQMELYKDFQKRRKTKSFGLNDLDYFIHNDVLDDFGMVQKPTYKYKHMPPRIFCIVDDCINCPIFIGKGSQRFAKLCLTSRHIGKSQKGVLGVSLAILSQSLTTQVGGLAKCVRENSCVVAIKNTKDKDKLKNTYKELADDLEEEQFYALLELATKDSDYNFLVIDYNAKCPRLKFRRNFNEFLILEGTKCTCKSKKKDTNKSKNKEEIIKKKTEINTEDKQKN
jgi:hypothetical protein